MKDLLNTKDKVVPIVKAKRRPYQWLQEKDFDLRQYKQPTTDQEIALFASRMSSLNTASPIIPLLSKLYFNPFRWSIAANEMQTANIAVFTSNKIIGSVTLRHAIVHFLRLSADRTGPVERENFAGSLFLFLFKRCGYLVLFLHSPQAHLFVTTMIAILKRACLRDPIVRTLRLFTFLTTCQVHVSPTV